MKIKGTISIVIVCVLLVTVLNAVMVYAPQPPDIPSSPFQEVIVANTDPIPVEVTDVSGWLHTTREEEVITHIENSQHEPADFDTSGYRTITLTFNSDVAAEVFVFWYVGYSGSGVYMHDVFQTIAGGMYLKTYEVIGHTLRIVAYSLNTGEEGDMKINVYLTT